jgi:hypothetical protein
MSVISGQVVTIQFTTRDFATGIRSNADSLPTGTLVLNGVDNGAAVTITNVSTGLYRASVTLPALVIADELQLRITATVAGKTDAGMVWMDVCDATLNANDTELLRLAAAILALSSSNLTPGTYTAGVGTGTLTLTITTDKVMTATIV